jgi:hypothetical protein
MKTITRSLIPLAFACAAAQGCRGPAAAPRPVHAGRLVIAADPATGRPPFTFSPPDQALLDEIGHATFAYFWNAASPDTGMVPDRTGSEVVSAAGVGFQLASLCVGARRGWVPRRDAEARALLILRSLEAEPTNRKAGLFFHFLSPRDASPRRVGGEHTVSTIDSAILFAGMLCAGQYFGGPTAEIADRLFADADWSFFLGDPDDAPPGRFVSLGWRPDDDADPTGAGSLIPYYWIDSGDEHRLVTFLAACAPDPAHRVDASVYWNLRRQIGWDEATGYVVWFPYSGALFTAFFAHCFINYAALGPDDPAAHGVPHRARVDWWENSRRTVALHRARAIANPLGLPTLGPDAWGLSACDGPEGYIVPGLYPEPVDMIGAEVWRDFADYQPEQDWGGGVVPPYAAGAALMFEPENALRALRRYRSLTDAAGRPGVWRGGAPGGAGFADAFTLDARGRVDWAAADLLAIDQGPLLLGIENARSGLLWDLFMGHPEVRAGIERLGVGERRSGRPPQ